MRIFMSGGTGFVGEQVRRALLARGHKLKLLVHSRKGVDEAGVEEIAGDISELSSYGKAMAGCDAAINLVGIIREFPSRNVTFERLHVQATKNMITAARDAGVKRYLQMSALGAWAGATTHYFKSKHHAEEEVRRSGLQYTIFRPSIIFGPKDEFINQMAHYIRAYPVIPVIGDGEYQLQPIAAVDVARCFAEALEKPETIGQIYELCGPDRMSFNALLDNIGRAIGKPNVLKVHNPVMMMRLIVPFLQRFPAFPLTTDQLEMLVQGSVCDGKWRETFAFELTPFEEGISTYLNP